MFIFLRKNVLGQKSRTEERRFCEERTENFNAIKGRHEIICIVRYQKRLFYYRCN